MQIDCVISDKNGTMVPYGENTIHFHVSGGAQLIGTDNGDSIDHTVQTSPIRKAFYGMCAATIQLKKVEAPILVLAIGALGKKYFRDTCEVTIVVEEYYLGGQEIRLSHNAKVYYTLNGNSEERMEYINPFILAKTTTVVVEVELEGGVVLEYTELFYQGEKPKVVDLVHRNKVLELDRPVGPFANQMVGSWSDGSFDFVFAENGELYRSLTDSDKQPLGYWWYDYPVDFFEAQEYAGTGEIWLLTGEKIAIQMLTQEGKEVEIDNQEGAIRSAYGFESRVTLKRK